MTTARRLCLTLHGLATCDVQVGAQHKKSRIQAEFYNYSLGILKMNVAKYVFSGHFLQTSTVEHEIFDTWVFLSFLWSCPRLFC